jgi:hypothetical protein
MSHFKTELGVENTGNKVENLGVAVEYAGGRAEI